MPPSYRPYHGTESSCRTDVGAGGPGERPAVRVGRGGPPGAEVMPQGGRVAESGPVGDDVDRLVGLFEQLLGQQDPLADEPALRRGPGLLDEAAGGGKRGHGGQNGPPADPRGGG